MISCVYVRVCVSLSPIDPQTPAANVTTWRLDLFQENTAEMRGRVITLNERAADLLEEVMLESLAFTVCRYEVNMLELKLSSLRRRKLAVLRRRVGNIRRVLTQSQHP